MKAVKIFDVKLEGSHKVEAADSNEAITKTIQYFSQNLDKLDFSWSEDTAYVEEE